jgi:nicotinate-nucleotide adenylyltransferase
MPTVKSAAKIGLLTGTFDPVHAGHVELAQAALRNCGLDEVWLLVNPDPGHKAAAVPFRHRLDMARKAVEAAPGLRVYDGAWAEESHVMPTFLRIVASHPEEYRFVFVLGMDAFLRLDGWGDVESVVNNATYAVAHRTGSAASEIGELRWRLGWLGPELKVSVFEFDGYEGVSSTAVRRALRAGELPDGLPAGVYEYILRQGLYR